MESLLVIARSSTGQDGALLVKARDFTDQNEGSTGQNGDSFSQ